MKRRVWSRSCLDLFGLHNSVCNVESTVRARFGASIVINLDLRMHVEAHGCLRSAWRCSRRARGSGVFVLQLHCWAFGKRSGRESQGSLSSRIEVSSIHMVDVSLMHWKHESSRMRAVNLL